MATARNDYQLACAWDLIDEIYHRHEPKEIRVDHHGFIRQGMLEEYLDLHRIANAIFQGATYVDLKGQRFPTQRMASGTITGFKHKGLLYLEQNPAKDSPYGKRANAGEKIIWILFAGAYIGRIDNGVVWKDPNFVKPTIAQPLDGKTIVIHIKDAPGNWKRNPQYVYIGRRNFAENLPRSKWCNPVSLRTREDQEREENLRQFNENFEISALRQQVGELKGKILVCYCHPQLCHGHTLAAAANSA